MVMRQCDLNLGGVISVLPENWYSFKGEGGGCLFNRVDRYFAGLVRWGVLALALSPRGTQRFTLTAICLQVSLWGVVFTGWRVGGCDQGQRVIRDQCCLP
jgi:hypothetical protein